MKKVVMTSLALLTLSVSLMAFQLSSAGKASAGTKKAENQVLGLWIGTYTVDGQPKLGKQYFSFILKPGGMLIVDTKFGKQQYLSTGTWSLDNTTLNCNFTCVYGEASSIGVTESSTAEWDNADNLTGTWKNYPPLTGSGNITLTRVK